MRNRLLYAMGLIVTAASNVFAASGAREDNSGVIVWVFLGFCALIVVAQLIPAILMVTGMLRAMITKKVTVQATDANK